jgi:hypothetical protein
VGQFSREVDPSVCEDARIDVQSQRDDSEPVFRKAKHAVSASAVFDDRFNSADNEAGNDWLGAAAKLLAADRLLIDEADKVLYDQRA